MRRVDTDGDSQGIRGFKRGGARPGPASRPRLRRAALESLERRELLSTLPAPITLSQSAVGSSDSGQGNSSSPSVAVDPINPKKMVAAWVVNDPNHHIDGLNQVTAYVQGAYSIDGGATWNALPNAEDADIQSDFTVAPAAGVPQPNFTQTTDATVAFGRDENVYLLSSTHSGGGGVLNLQRWAFTTALPIAATFNVNNYDGQTGGSSTTVNPVYRWQGADGALAPTLAVDSNIASFSDGTTTQSDPYVNNVYVAWETNDAAPKNYGGYNPNTIKLIASSNLGQDFTSQRYLNGHAAGNLYDQPKLAISQGGPGVAGGQVTVVYDNAGSASANAPYSDAILAQTSNSGGTDEHFESATNVGIKNAGKDQGGATGTDSIATTDIPINVNITDPKFASLQNLTLTLSLSYPSLAETSAVLIAPDGTTVTLWNNATNNDGKATNAGGTLSGANIGASAEKSYLGTTLDSTAFRQLNDGNVAAPYFGHFSPASSLISPFRGLTAAQLNSLDPMNPGNQTWTLEIKDYRNEATTTGSLIGAALDFSSGLTLTAPGDVQSNVATSFINSGPHPYTNGIQGIQVQANPSIASDNTLGSSSPHQGRLYVAFTNDNYNITNNAYTDSTFIEMVYSDNGGRSWSNGSVVNDDNGLVDGFSTGGFAQPNSGTGSINLRYGGSLSAGQSLFGPETNVRPKIDPTVAVNTYTGSVVVSYLDTRYDAAKLRVANFIAVSTDGGASYAPEVYANPSATQSPNFNVGSTQPIDTITGNPVNLGPIPDNQSTGNAYRDATFGFGQHQGLVVANGRIVPVWASNLNGASASDPGSTSRNQTTYSKITSAQVAYAAGPRVISSTQGPVGGTNDTVNTARASDGSPVANTIVLTFDRAVNPTTFPADGANPGASPLQVFYTNPAGGGKAQLRVTNVAHDSTNTIYTVTFADGGHGVGDYSYTLQPLVRGMIPYYSVQTPSATFAVPIAFNQSGSTTGDSAPFTVSGHPGQLLTSVTISAYAYVYQRGTGNPGSPNDLQVFLVPNGGLGTPIRLFRTSTAGQQFFTINRTINVSAIPAQFLDGTYTLRIVDNVAGDLAEVYGGGSGNNDSLTLSGTSTLTLTQGNLLDQNGDGVPGELATNGVPAPTNDVYLIGAVNGAVGAGSNSLPIIVPGPHATTVAVTGVNGVTSTGSDNLIVNDNVSSITVNFDRDIQVSSFTPAQVLKVIGPAGQINSPQTFTSTGTSRTFPYAGTVLPIPQAGIPGQPATGLSTMISISGTGRTIADLKVNVNITDPNDANLTLDLVAPDGTIIHLVAVNTASGANFTNTTFSDYPAADGRPSTVGVGQAPYSLTYQPATPLNALVGHLLDGNWTLVVYDSSTSGAAGRLNSWSLIATPQVPQGQGTPLNPVELTSTLNIAVPGNTFTIAHLAVQLLMTSARDSDLDVALIAPDGTVVPLFAGVGGPGRGFNNTTLDDNATVGIGSGVAPFSMTYQPQGSLATLIGKQINGTWTLRIRHPLVDNNPAALYSWSLIATPQITVTPVNPSNGKARTFLVGFPTQQLSGSYSVTLGSGITSGQGAALDTNLNAGLAALEGGTSIAPSTPDTFNATAVPVAIPAGPSSTAVPPSTLVSQINVTDNFAIQGDTDPLTGLKSAGLTLTLDITYPYDPDLTATLTHNGTTITLFQNVGNGSSTANFSGTTFTDVFQGNSATSISSGAPPFFGSFAPNGVGSGFAAFANELSGGLWTLTISNAGTQGFTGSLNSWSLSFQRPQTGTGLGEPVADQKTVSFRIFNIKPDVALSNDTWTAVGPTGITTSNVNASTTAKLSGPVSVVAIDSSDPSGNTAFVGAVSGGVWKTTNFLTTDAAGPTYITTTDFGPNFSLNIGSIAIFDRNNDPNQSIVFAGTGDGETNYGNPSVATRGVGFLKSTDGGSHWTLLDSTVNVDGAGNPLPINSPLRDHAFVGSTTYKIVVDPKAGTNGGVIVYAALGGTNGGLWRSLDGGGHWQNLTPSAVGGNAVATDVLLDPASGDSTTGNLDIVYAAFQNFGVYISTNQGQALALMAGNVGADNLIQNNGVVPARPLTVNDANPNGASGRILLAKPALTGSAAQNIQYQDWLYVAVENADGTFRGLYETKDRGENWTKAQIADIPTPPLVDAVTQALPTNDNAVTNNYDVADARGGNGSGGGGTDHNGNTAFSLTIDPTNPNIVYLGGTQDYQTSGLIRVDLTGIYDAHAFVPFASDRNDGGLLARDAVGRIKLNNTGTNNDPLYRGSSYTGSYGGYYLNLRHAPNDPFANNSTLYVTNADSFTNDGTGVTWKPLDSVYGAPLGGSTNIHQLVTIVDPLTGLTRLIVADDQGVFTGLYDASGKLSTAGIGTAPSVNGDRNGNLQIAELYAGAAQPSQAAANIQQALFYGAGVGYTDIRSTASILSTGNLTWTNPGVFYGDIQNVIKTNDRLGTAIATDQTGGTTVANPIGTGPSSYEYDEPFVGGDTTNFFRVTPSGQVVAVSRTIGLTNNYQSDFPGLTPIYNGVTPLGQFAVNPINGSQILIGTSNIGNATGDIYQTVNQGVGWSRIAVGTNDLDGTYPEALAYGAPDPNAPNGLGNLNNFLYAGTSGGNIFITTTGGSPWTRVSGGLDGSGVVQIITNPDRKSHEAYAITLKGVYYIADSVASATNPNPTWVNITGNLTQIQHDSYGSPSLAESVLAGYGGGGGNAQLGGFRSIVADYRYAIPDAGGAKDSLGNVLVHPVLYAAGYGGVFRSLDNGQTWTAFPNTAFDTAPVDGGYLPSVEVTNLTLNLGAIDPTNGRAVQRQNDPEVLLATTFGRGDFAIRLAPDVFSSTIHLDATLPAATATQPAGSDSGRNASDRVTNVLTPYIDGVSEISKFGNVVTITLIDMANGKVLGVGTTNAFGQFGQYTNPSDPSTFHLGIQIVKNGVNNDDASFFMDSPVNVFDDHIIGIQATDSAGAKGNITPFAYTLRTTPPTTPGTPTLDPGSRTSPIPGFITLTNQPNPTIDITTTEPGTTYLNLYRLDPNQVDRANDVQDPRTGAYRVLVGTAQAGVVSVSFTDNELAALLGGKLVYTNLQYVAEQVDLAGNVSATSSPLTITLKNTLPPTLQAPTLELASNSGLDKSQRITNVVNPYFDVSALESSNSRVFLYRSFNGGTAINVGYAALGSTRVQDIIGAHADGTYQYQVVQLDAFGNMSLLGPATAVTIDTQAPAAPTLTIFGPDDSGAPAHPDFTNVRNPRFQGTGTAGLQIVVYVVYGVDPSRPVSASNPVANHGQDLPVAQAAVAADGSYLANSFGPLDDGTYSFEARTIDAAGNITFSAPLVLTINATGPKIVPSLSIALADDTGVKGDGVTANHRPRFTGKADKGDTVTLYSLVNGQLSQPQASTTASTLDGSFTLQLPFNLVDGSTQLVTRVTDVAGNTGPISPAFLVRIITVAGDYANTGSAQFTVFRPSSETYIIRGIGALQVDVTPGRDIPTQFDFNGDGRVDQVAYRFDAAQYNGFLSDGSVYRYQLGQGGDSLPVSGYYDSSGTLLTALFNPDTGVWGINTPTPGGRIVTFGAPDASTGDKVIPTPAAFDGNGVTEIAFFRPQDDSFYVLAPNPSNAQANYRIGLSDPVFANQGFVYKAGDIPAPADYDGIGRAEFAVYRPTTGQFFIVRVPNLYDSSTWTVRTVSLNIPGGPKPGDVPASQDYEGTGKASPTVFRPSNSTFYEIQTTSGFQQNIQFGQPGLDVAAAGPILYRLSALNGGYATTDGYPASVATTGGGSYTGSGATARAAAIDVSPASAGTSSALATASTIALATPTPVVTATPAAPAVAIPSVVPVAAAAPLPAPVVATAVAPPASHGKVIVGTATPKAVATHHAAAKAPAHVVHARPPAAAARPAPAAPKKVIVHPTAAAIHHPASANQHQAAVAAALKSLGPIKLKSSRRDD